LEIVITNKIINKVNASIQTWTLVTSYTKSNSILIYNYIIHYSIPTTNGNIVSI